MNGTEVAIAAAGMVVGTLIGSLMWPAPSPQGESASIEAHTAPTARKRRPAAECERMQRVGRSETAALERQRKEKSFALAMAHGRETARVGREVAWPEAPGALAPRTLEARMQGHLDALGLELLHIDCLEYPCLMAFLSPTEQDGTRFGGIEARLDEDAELAEMGRSLLGRDLGVERLQIVALYDRSAIEARPERTRLDHRIGSFADWLVEDSP